MRSSALASVVDSRVMSRFHDGYEMRDRHRLILIKHRPYLLHNLCVTEPLWATLISNELLSPDMVEECKTGLTSTEKIGKLLDMIPTRGPEAFDRFCEALLECDHAHVAEYLKTLEATEQFAQEIKPHCVDVSENLTEKFVKIFQKSTPSVQRFAERKFQIIMEEQDRDLASKEEELRQMENKNMFLQLEVTQLRSHLNSCYETSDNIAQEIQNTHVSRTFVNEESAHLKNLHEQLKDIKGFEKIREFYSNIIELLRFLETCRENRIKNDNNNAAAIRSRAISTRGKTMNDKMHMLIEQLSSDAYRLGSKSNVPGVMVKAELENILKTFKDIVTDVHQIRDVFRNTMRQKRKMEGEVLSMLHNFQEIRRLEREIKEKHLHISDLGKQGTFMRKKTVNKQNRKQIEQIQQTIDQKKLQTKEIQKSLEQHICSADQRLHALLNLLPDLEDSGNEFLRSDTEMTSDIESHAGSRLGTPLGTVRPTSAIFNKNTYKKLAETLGKRDANGQNANDNENEETNTSDSEDETRHNKPDTDKQNTEENKQSEVTRKPEPIKGQNTSPKVSRRQPQMSKVTLARSRRTDASSGLSPTRVKQHEKSKKITAYSAEDIDRWVAQEKANEKLRAAAQKPLVASNSTTSNSTMGKCTSVEPAKTPPSRAPTMLTIAESQTERESQSHRASSQQTTLRHSQPRLSLDSSVKLGSKEYYQKHKQRQSYSESEYEKGYFETKNSSTSSVENRSGESDKGSSPTEDQRSHDLTASRLKLDDSTSSRDRFLSSSRTTFEADQEGSLTARKRKQSLLSPTDLNANLNFVEEETKELSQVTRPYRHSRSPYKETKVEKIKPMPSSREVLKFNRIDLIGCLPGN